MTASADRTLVVVGASLAGAKAAEGARTAGFDGRVVLVGDERELPYERPPLSKAVLRGDAEPDSARVHAAGFYAEHEIELRLGRRAVTLDVDGRQVELDDGERVPFTAAVLATGAAPRALHIPGADLAGVHHLRSLDDAASLGAAVRHGSRVAVIGAGWIGSEVAASARQLGAEVVLVDPAPVPLHRVLGREIGDVFRRLHAGHGVDLRLGTGVAELRGGDSVEAVVLGDGRVEPADVVVVGVGVVPRVELAEQAGLKVDNGIVVDQHLRARGEVFAAGDVATAWHPHYGRHLRVAHWANALNQGLTAAANDAGAGESYTRLPYFFSDQYDLGMEYVGHGDPRDRVVVRGDVEGMAFVAYWLRDGRVTAAMHVNVWDVIDDLKALVGSGRVVARSELVGP